MYYAELKSILCLRKRPILFWFPPVVTFMNVKPEFKTVAQI